MKTKLMIIAMAVATTYSVVGSARDSIRELRDRRPVMTPVKWMGSLRCDEKIHDPGHQADHACDLKFVNDATGEEWNVKDNAALQTIHQNQNAAVKAHVEAKSSPRYAFGGSYIEIERIETVPQEKGSEVFKADADLSEKPAHVCALGTPATVN